MYCMLVCLYEIGIYSPVVAGVAQACLLYRLRRFSVDVGYRRLVMMYLCLIHFVSSCRPRIAPGSWLPSSAEKVTSASYHGAYVDDFPRLGVS